MMLLWILAGCAVLALAAVLASYICYRIAFYAPPQKNEAGDAIEIPDGEIYEVFRDKLENWVREMRAMPHEEFSIESFDGLTLYGKYYEYKPGAPIELMFPGYRGSAERDLAGGVQRCFQVGHNVLLADQRCSGRSEGNVITFGIREYRDCLKWVDFAVEHFGPDAKIILTGISMGASTVLMAAGEELPSNVVGVLADCGYTSAKAIICHVSRMLHLPAWLMYPLIRLGGFLFAGFDLEENSPIEAVKQIRIPVIFAHGEADDFVPCSMSRENYDACAAPKCLYTAPGAGHGLCYLVAGEDYIRALREFWTEQGIYE